jgi:hypothetical protein
MTGLIESLQLCGMKPAALEEWTGIEAERLERFVEGLERPTAEEVLSIVWAMTVLIDGLPDDDAAKIRSMHGPRLPRSEVGAAVDWLFAEAGFGERSRERLS